MSKTTTKDRLIPFVGKCKACKAPIRVSVPEEVKKTEGTKRSVQGYDVDDVSYWYTYAGYSGREPLTVTSAPCPTCGKTATLKRLKVVNRPEVKCGARCRGSTGPVCECSCHGKNHGVG